MKYYINIRFGSNNKTYYFATDLDDLKIGDFVVVETVVGVELGEVTTFPRELETLNYDREVKPILRKANKSDLLRYEENKALAEEANTLFLKSVEELALDMRLIGSEYTLDRTKILFTYVADDRVDFRELLKVLAANLKCRIELRQINARERAQLVGGIGTCGLPLCCTTFLTHFDGVTLSKVKNQMLAINIPKISGQCGKLMCCLKFEDDLYTEIKKDFPPINSKFDYKGKEYKVSSFSIFTKIIKIVAQDDTQFITLNEFKSLHEKIQIVEDEDIDLSNPDLKEVLTETESETTRKNREAEKARFEQKTAQKSNKNEENRNKPSFDKDKKRDNFNKENKQNKEDKHFHFNKDKNKQGDKKPDFDKNQKDRNSNKQDNRPPKKNFHKGFRPYVDPNKKD